MLLLVWSDTANSAEGGVVVVENVMSTAQGYLAVPESGSGPGVVVIGESWTVRGHLRSVCERFAAEGFVAFAPDLRGRSDGPEDAAPPTMGPDMDSTARDVDAAARELRERFGGAVGVVGFGLGGTLALRAAGLSADLGAVVAFYPAATPTVPGDYAGTSVVIHGTGTDLAAEDVRQAIEATGGQVTVYDHPGAPPGFFDDDRPEVYSDDAARSAWARSLELFRTRLV